MNPSLLNLALVGAGGALGAMARYGVGGLVNRNAALANFPFGTLAVNLLGCLLIGLGAGLADAKQAFAPEARLFLFVGVLAGSRPSLRSATRRSCCCATTSSCARGSMQASTCSRGSPWSGWATH
jgi:hypothetical protein